MADEPASEVEGQEPTIAAPEVDAEVASPRTVEDYAREHGWKPKDEWSGEGEWRDAESFISFGFERSRDLNRDLKDLRQSMDNIVRTNADITQQVAERARKEERAKWEFQLTAAVEEGDSTKALEASNKIAELSAQPQQSQNPGDNPLVQKFVSDNPWFSNDPAAHAVAVATAGEVAKRQGGVEEQLKAAKEAVMKRFPEYAPQQAKAIDVAQTQGRTAVTGGRKKGFSDMPAEAQQAAKHLVQRGLLKSVDGYVHRYFNPEGAIE